MSEPDKNRVAAKPGVLTEYDGRYWGVRWGDGPTHIYWLRPMDIRVNESLRAGLEVELFFDVLPSQALWKARPRPTESADTLNDRGSDQYANPTDD